MSVCLSAATLAVRGQSYRIEVYGQEEGLHSSEINAIAQDGRGRLWLATRAGLFAFDGILWESHEPNYPPAISFSFISSDALGRIWAVNETKPYTVACYEKGVWRKLPALAQFPSFAVTGLAVALSRSGPQVAVASRQSGLAFWDGVRWSHLASPETGRIYGLAAQGQSFYLASSRGLLRMREGKLEEVALQGPSTEDPGLLGVYPDPHSGSLIIHASGWLASWKEGKLGWLFENDDLRLEGSAIRGLGAGRDGWVYLATNEQLLQIQPETGRILPLGRENGLNSNGARALFVDRENSLWIANRMGLVRVAGRRFANFDTRQGFLEDEVTAVLQSGKDEMVLGHNSGLTFWKAGRVDKVRFPKISDGWKGVTRVLDLRSDRQGRVWAAASWAGLARIEGESITWYGSEAGLTVPVSSVLEDRSGVLWVAADRQLFRWERGRFVPSELPRLGKGAVRRIFESRRGILYLATSHHGLLAGRPGNWRRIGSHPTEETDSVYALLEDSRGRIWAGTGGGLYRVDSGKLVPAAPVVFPQPRPVYAILEDGQGNLWFGTDSGVVLWDGIRSRRLASRDGLAGQETNRAAALLDSRNRVWIGTDRGLSLYQPEFDCFVPAAPGVEVLSAWAAGEDLPLTGEASLSTRQNTLQFGFRALSLRDPHSIRYRFRLSGFEEQWQHQDNPYQRQVRYASLPPGRFRFEVQAGSPQRWGTSSSGPWIVIHPPFYLQWWFAPLSLASLLLAGWLVKVQRSRKELHQRYRRLVEAAPEAILLFDPEKGRFVAANQNARRMLKADKSRLYGMGWPDCSPARQPGGSPSVEASGQYVNQALEGLEPVFEWVLQDTEGKEVPSEVRLSHFASGRRSLVRASIHDISERKRLKGEAQLRTRHLQALTRIGHLAIRRSDSGFVKRALALVQESLQSPCCLLLWAGPPAQEVRLAASISDGNELVLEADQDAHLIMLAKRLRTNSFVALNWPVDAGPPRPAWPGSEGLEEVLAARIDMTGERFGVLAAYGDKGKLLGLADRDFLENAAQIISTSIERGQAEGMLRQSLQEKEILLKEIHHRVKNNLQVVSSLLSLQARRAESGNAASDLNQSRNRIRTMALIHELLYQSQDLRQIDFQEYLTSLTRNLIRASSLSDHVSVTVDARSVRFDVDTAVPCGLIVNELVSNALQHAFDPGREGRIEVTVRHLKDNSYTLSVGDDGCGLLEGIDVQTSDSLGLVLVRALTRQLQGSLDILDGPGTCFRIKFRLPRCRHSSDDDDAPPETPRRSHLPDEGSRLGNRLPGAVSTDIGKTAAGRSGPRVRAR